VHFFLNKYQGKPDIGSIMLSPDSPKRQRLDAVLRQRFAGQPALPVAVVWPCDPTSLEGAVSAAAQGIIEPVLLGPGEVIEQVARDAGLDLTGLRIEPVESEVQAATTAVRMAKDGEVRALMKGSLHTNELMRAVVSKEGGLRTSRRMSHVFAIDHPHYHKPLLVTDAALNIAPDLPTKRDIAQNAIDLAIKLGVHQPKVAILAAVETVEVDVESTLHAAALCKMASRKQIKGALLDGPLALDNALSDEACRIKGIVSDVAGDADILLVPHYEAGNMLAKDMEHLGGALSAGVVVGAKVPVILTSRSDTAVARVASCLLARAAVAKSPIVSGVVEPTRKAANTPERALGTGQARRVLTLNAGSSSVKFALYLCQGTDIRELLLEGSFERIGRKPRVTVDIRGGAHQELGVPAYATQRTCVEWLLHWLTAEGYGFDAVAHRVVHGGTQFSGAVRLDAPVLAELSRLVGLAPLHQPHNLAGIAAVSALAGEVPQFACFDTAFHRTQSEEAQMFALPRELFDEGVRRYGFHGLSYEYISRQDELAAYRRVVVCHLGSGASACALQDGKSVATTMGFTALDGLMMGTRCGALDPGVVFHLQRMGLPAQEVEAMLYKQSGLLGVSGVSSDMRDVRKAALAGNSNAQQALALYTDTIAHQIAGLATRMGGIEALVFTAGVGENDAALRADVARRLEWLGLELKAQNGEGKRRISSDQSRIAVWVMPTSEERMLCTHALQLLESATQVPSMA
jgi:acetate kinase